MQGQAIATAADLPKLVGYQQLRELYGWPKRTVQDWIKARKFPKPLNLPGRGNYWALDDIVVWMKGDLTEVAVTRPEDLSPEQLEDEAVGLVVKSMVKRTGQPVDAGDLGIHVMRRITQDELLDAERREFAIYADRFAHFDVERAVIVAAWMFPALRELFARSVEGNGVQIYRDPERLREVGRAGLHDDTWAELIESLGLKSE